MGRTESGSSETDREVLDRDRDVVVVWRGGRIVVIVNRYDAGVAEVLDRLHEAVDGTGIDPDSIDIEWAVGWSDPTWAGSIP